MHSLLLIIDVQNVFINDETNELPKKIYDLINENKFSNVVFTRFINSYESVFYTKLKYNGCLSDEDKTLAINPKNFKVIDKKGYTAYTKELIEYIEKNRINKIYLCGIDTESCVLKTAFDLFENGYDIYVLKDYCASTLGIERHNNAIEILKRNIGKDKIIGSEI